MNVNSLAPLWHIGRLTRPDTLKRLNSFFAPGNSFQGDSKPWLFCGGTWIEETTILRDPDTSQPYKYKDPQGKEMTVDVRKTNPNDVDDDDLKDILREFQEKDANGNCEARPKGSRDDHD